VPYDPREIEPKWQAWWRREGTYRTSTDRSKPKFYVLDMFPYPSGAGLHVGHPKGYIATDVLSRYKRMRGFRVLHPMGWDAFGLPAEQYAIQTGTHPRETTRKNIATYKRQLQALGMDYDWEREIDTTDPRYVKWTQWIFTLLYQRGLAYEAEVPVNWCPALGTVLANEEVIDGRSERGNHPVVRLPMRQWMLRITAYAERLLDDLRLVDWPEPIVKMQRDWIGRSEGARVRFPVSGGGDAIEVFTTRPDTLFGATYMVLAPEHPLVEKITPPARRAAVSAYVEAARRKSERARMAEVKTKSGVDTGARARNPATGAEIPIWIADYVLAGYGTGAIMAVPGHDERDFEFARAFGLPIVEVVSGGDLAREAFTGDGVAVNSGFLDGLATPEAKQHMLRWLEAEGHGRREITYKLRDWLFSRQRYWGEPFPLLHLEDGSVKILPLEALPVMLPEVDDYRPRDGGRSPLESAADWIETVDPDTGRPARRDRNTMPNWAGSCWYYLRFVDPHNDAAAFSPESERDWMNVDLYVGGAEHAVLHLLYARFWHKVLFDAGYVHTPEPFQKLLNPGQILGHSYRYWDDDLADDPAAKPRRYPSSAVRVEGEKAVAVATGVEVKARFVPPERVRWSDGVPMHPDDPDLVLEEVVERMSKSRGNVVNPDDVVAEHGADAFRMYEMFMGPLEKGAPWSTEGIPGVSRFLQRAWKLVAEDPHAERGTPAQERVTARAVHAVTQDMEALAFNTAISKLMVFAREISEDGPAPRAALDAFVRMLAPLAPHLAEELWRVLGHQSSVAHAPWPEADPALLEVKTLTLVVQVNGKRRADLVLPADADEAAVRAAALALEPVQRHLEGRAPKKVIVVPGRLVNVVG
jgi:leucyl-tRNA synthetase